MLCSHCGKREVEVLIKQVVNQEVHNVNLCKICAEELGFISPDIPSFTISFSLNEVDAQKQKKIKRLQPKKKEQVYDTLQCPECETTYLEFRETGLLGCPECYEAFRFPLGAYLQKEQGAESHWDVMSGLFSDIEVVEDQEKVAAMGRLKDEQEANIRRLQSELSEAVSREEYERAAELRDLLRPKLAPEHEHDTE